MKRSIFGLFAGVWLGVCSWAEGGPLVSTQWLDDHLDDPSVRVVSVEDVDVPAYATGHIPGAVQVVLQTDLMTPVRRNFLGVDALEALASRLGLRAGQTLVFYDAGDVPEGGLPSIYGYWVFRYRGAANIAVLDGGLAKWKAEGRAVTTDVPHPKRGDYRLAGTVPSVRMFANDILRRLPRRNVKLIDVRTRDEYLGRAAAPPGKPDVVLALGHIPTARHVYWAKSLTAAGTFKSRHRLLRLYRKWLRPSGPPIASYCLRGERGVVTWFVLHEMLGQERARLYDGSWSEWGNLVKAPVER
jgi:thiosulfate/3-mercaptopyruvate sulfurtransferase